MLIELGTGMDEYSENFQQRDWKYKEEPVSAEEYNNQNEKHTRESTNGLDDAEEWAAM